MTKYTVHAWLNQETDDWGTDDPPPAVLLTETAFDGLVHGDRAKHLEHGVDFIYADEGGDE